MYSFLCFIIPNAIWQVVNKGKYKGKEHVIRHIVWTYVFMLYCYLAVEVAADMGTMWDIIKYGGIRGVVYLKPFMIDELKSHILNVIMFMPLGFLLPLVWNNFRKILKVAIVGLLMSLAIEVSQLFCYRTTDINDLITNTLGTITGYMLWIIFHKIFKRSGQKAVIMHKLEPVIYIFVGMFGIFFLYKKN